MVDDPEKISRNGYIIVVFFSELLPQINVILTITIASILTIKNICSFISYSLLIKFGSLIIKVLAALKLVFNMIGTNLAEV